MITLPDEQELYSGCAEALQLALKQSGIILPAASLPSRIATHFERKDILLARAITERLHLPWYVVEAASTPLGEMALENDTYAVNSLAEGVALVVNEFDEHGIYPTAVRAENGELVFLAGQEMLVKVRPMEFQKCPPEAHARYTNLTKGIRSYGDGPRLLGRFKKIPGFHNMQGGLGDDRLPPAHLLVAMPENFPVAMEALLKAASLDVRRTQAADLFARMVGVKDWQTFSGLCSQWEGALSPLVLMRKLGRGWSYTFYKDTASGIWGFTEALREYATKHGERTIQHVQEAEWVKSLSLELELLDRPGAMEMQLETMSLARLSEEYTVDTWEAPCATGFTEVTARRIAEAMKLGGSAAAIRSAGDLRQGKRSKLMAGMLFTVYPVGPDDEPYLKVQQVSEEGIPLPLKAGQDGVALFKADLELEGEDALVIRGNYRKKVLLRLESLSPQVIEEISEFTGLAINSIPGSFIR